MPEVLLPRPLTFLHLLGELVMLQECQHIHLWVLLQEGLHSHSSTTQAEVEVPKPEDLIKPGSDIPWAHVGEYIGAGLPLPAAICWQMDGL